MVAPSIPPSAPYNAGLAASPASQYKFMIPTRQTTGNAADVSGHGAQAGVAINLGMAAAWANPGYATVGAGSGLGYFIQLSKSNFDLSSQSILLAITVNLAAPVSNAVILGNGNSGTGVYGVFIQAQTDGTVRPFVSTSAGVSALTASTTAIVCDSTSHHVVLAIDGSTKDVALYVDGVLNVYALGAYSGNTTGMVSNFNIGSQGLAASLGPSTTIAMKWRDAHLLVFNGPLPLNVTEIAQKLSSCPERILVQRDITFATKTIIVTIAPGQSNEAGNGFFADISGVRGVPMRDPVAPNGSTARSMWPYLATLAGRRGTKLEFYNRAVGSTSLANSWVGLVKQWISGLMVQQGNLVLSSGGIWKVTGSGSFDATIYTSTVAPTGTSNITTGDGISWTYLGTPTATDVAGRVQQPTDTHFDPNGYLAASLAGISSRTGFDAKYAFTSIGQGDFVLGVTRDQYTQAMESQADYFLAVGIRVALGMTFYDASAGAEAYYQSTLLPGLADALAHYSGNPNVIAGANLRTAVGVLPVNNQFIPALKTDTVHANDPALALGSEAWDTALAVASVYGGSVQ